MAHDIVKSAPRTITIASSGASSGRVARRGPTTSAVIDGASSPRLAHIAIALICATIVAFLGWANALPLKVLVVGDGEILPEGFTRQVQHLEGGQVASILIEEDGAISAGQVIAIMAQENVENEVVRLQREATRLRQSIERLSAIAEGRAPVRELLADGGAARSQDQTALFNVQRAAATATLERIDAKIAASQRLAQSIEGQVRHAEAGLTILLDAMERRRPLLEQGLVRLTEFEALEREALSARRELASLRASLVQERLVEREVLAERRETLARLRETAFLELEERRAEQDQVATEIGRLSRILERSTVRAPFDGLVKRLAVRPDAVIEPGGVIAEIVPADRRLFAQVRIAPQDIARVNVGDEAMVEVTAFDRQRFGTLDAVVDAISPDAFTDESGVAYFRVRIGLAPSDDQQSRIQVSAGMSVIVRVVSGERTLLQYLLKPVRELFESPFGEA